MFPITDPHRRDDIRMRRRRAAWLLVGIVAVPVLLFSGREKSAAVQHGSGAMLHGAATDSDDLNIDLHSLSVRSGSLPGTEIQSIIDRIPFVRRLNWMVQGAPLPAGRRDGAALSAGGTSLTVALPCTSSITLVPKADLSDRVFVSASGGGQNGIAGLTLGGGAGLTLAGACERGRPDLIIQAPPAMKLTLVQEGDTDLRLGSFTGPIVLTQNGSGDAVIDASGPLIVQKAGSGDLAVGRLTGLLHLVQSGSGDTVVSSAEAGMVDAVLRGSGNLTIPNGHIGHLAAVLHGSGDLSVGAEVGSAAVRAGPDNDVTLPHVIGRLDRSVAGDQDE